MKSAIVSAFILAFLSANLAVAAPQSGGQSVQGSPQVQGGLRPQAGSQPQGGQQPQAGKPVEPAVQAMGPPQKIEQYQQLTKKKMQHPGKCKIKNLKGGPRHSCVASDLNQKTGQNQWDVECRTATGCRYQGDDCYILISTETDKTKPSSGRLEAEAMCQGTGSQPGSPNPYASSSSPGSPISVGSGSPPGSPNVAGGGSPGSPISVGSGSQPGSPNGSGGGSQQGNTRGQNA
ncbi:hypothetical protein CA14_004344 [Aspergillus flavus]|uniref:Uncharacterized protein n=1 Tax=Aspergillus flavus TaxID=5059 RepID=A0AB74CDE0_ASPFL|nr:hypothetical protein NYO67_10086 [Aspergillus flavus]RMZ44178.1 hypothetical protein CA14_004344 [Aspergillus flavus]